MIHNVCIFSSIQHIQSGKELDIGYLNHGTIIESFELNSPKLILSFRDHTDFIKQELQIQVYDELKISYGDAWRGTGISEQETFTVLTVTPKPDGTITINALAQPVYAMKQISEKSRLFVGRGIIEILKAVLSGSIKKFDFGKFPIIEQYHVVAGERPSATLRQIATEMGCHIWYCRGCIHLKTFADMFNASPAVTFHHGRIQDDNVIIKYSAPSKQLEGQEKYIRSFTGWDEKQGRISASSQNPILSMAKSKPVAITGLSSPFTLGNAVVATKPVIGMITVGNMSVEPGQVIQCLWHLPDPARPINEALPPKIVAGTVAHWYSAQKYYCRIKGVLALESA